jgi:hypothetical protein
MREVIYGMFLLTVIGGIRFCGALGHADFPTFGLFARNRCAVKMYVA